MFYLGRGSLWMFFSMLSALLLAGCGKQNTYNANSARWNSLAVSEKAKALLPAINKYCGLMHLIKHDIDFDVELLIQRGDDNIHSSVSQDPTDTIQVPKLVGYMRFVAIQDQGSAAYLTLPPLMAATGGFSAISFTYGDYDPLTRRVYLPFSVPGHTQGNYGEVRATLDTNTKHLSGVWYSNSFEELGSFDLPPCGKAK